MGVTPDEFFVAGVDEAGAGPLAGPVVAAAVILPVRCGLEGLTDSKLLSDRARRRYVLEIRTQALAWAIGRVDNEEIDRLNILQARLLAMQRAVEALDPQPHKVLVDGDRCPHLACDVEAIIKGDLTIPQISAASILAKVCRDDEMIALDGKFPGYGFAVHKGYGTKMHLDALARLGACPVHRKTFSPVRRVMEMYRDQ